MVLALTLAFNTKDGTLKHLSHLSLSLERSLLSLHLHHELNQPRMRSCHSRLSLHHLIVALQLPRCRLTPPFARYCHHRDRRRRPRRTGTATVTAIAIGVVVVVILL
jgi:hypothetical protein